ncbi:hypothetical protein A5724_10210 [Mycobacterium sp. ACS1612]|uniref:DUF1707 SHOCT-like domain-containing protein n=1 Tax=Mycobacterium sp. ACS1612 TaxID=1834117 RepID=UPI0007FFF616|nr:DUF1707 domain-containing protein [Mycobacterium sp. ACS1612]OBF38102.1 hypothetical protein A5724_10210 [Mycobacterium sp. ACS1612]
MATRHTPGTRAKDSDRNDTCQILDSALADGQLSMEEHRTRVALATGAETLGDLQSLVSDLQTNNAPVQLPDLKKRPKIAAGGSRGIAVAMTAVLVVLGILIGWGLYGNSTSPLDFTKDPGAKPDGVVPLVETPPTELQSLGGLSGLFTQMRAKFGDTTGYSLMIWPNRASLTRPDPRDDRRVLTYDYRGGWDDPSSSTKSGDNRVVDLAKFDYPAIIGRTRGAAEILKMNSQKIEDVRIDIENNSDPLDLDGLNISIYVSGEFNSGYIKVAPDGTCERCEPAT